MAFFWCYKKSGQIWLAKIGANRVGCDNPDIEWPKVHVAGGPGLPMLVQDLGACEG